MRWEQKRHANVGITYDRWNMKNDSLICNLCLFFFLLQIIIIFSQFLIVVISFIFSFVHFAVQIWADSFFFCSKIRFFLFLCVCSTLSWQFLPFPSICTNQFSSVIELDLSQVIDSTYSCENLSVWPLEDLLEFKTNCGW